MIFGDLGNFGIFSKALLGMSEGNNKDGGVVVDESFGRFLLEVRNEDFAEYDSTIGFSRVGCIF